MTAEEYIKSKKHEDYPGGHLCYTVSEEDALKAIEMARNEKQNNSVGLQGWVCPKCGRVYSPYTSMCKFCANDIKINAQCALQSEIGMRSESEYPINSKFNK